MLKFSNKRLPALLKRDCSPYPLDASVRPAEAPQKFGRILIDGVFKGDYSLAIVNRYLARSLLRLGCDVSIFTPEDGWQSDAMLSDMADVKDRCLHVYPERGTFDIHLRNTWPPKADDMVGSRLNGYVCFAWEELEVPRNIIDHFNTHLDLMMVTATFVEQSLRHSGLKIPLAVVGDGTDHVLDFISRKAEDNARQASSKRVLHVSSCFPRKGADLLVDAFTQTFAARDNVELVIKTFDNPHNTIDAQVAQLRVERPDSAQVSVIKKSMTYPELVALMQSSDLLVAPSRGEGFGLPLAEALLLGVPVVTTAYSGQTDFCSASTAWLVDYTMVPSAAHVSSDGAQWAQPDLGSLGQQMRSALADTSSSRQKVTNAQALLKAHFKWSDVARRVTQAMAQALDGRNTARKTELDSGAIRIDLVSTFDQICGIASYSEHLFDTKALRPALARVLAREVRGDDRLRTEHSTVEVQRPWGYDRAGVNRLTASLAAGRADVVWFQHHPAFFSVEDMNIVCNAGLSHSAYKVKAITLHNVKEAIGGSVADWLKAFDVVVVHTQADADLLAERGIAATVIAHGILDCTAHDNRDSSTFTIGTFGFLYPHKNIPLLISALGYARSVDQRLRLKLMNCARNDPVSLKERVHVENAIQYLGLSDVVETDFSFIDDDEVIARLAACDVLCFPYGSSTESATGAARIALAANRPLLCSQSGVLTDMLPHAIVLSQLSPQVLAEALLVLAASPVILGLRDTERQAYVAANSYEAVARQHMKVIASRLM